MVENKLQSGYINCMNKPYIFTYDGELLQLVPKDEESIKPYDSFKNKNINYEVLEGDTIGFDKIFFLNCRLQVSLSGYIAKPAGYVCFSNGERQFDVITFKGGTIDYFYRPNHIIDESNTQYDYNTGVRYMREFVEQKRKLPDVFVCVNDNIAAGICTEAEKNGYQVPRDFKVTGFDNLDKAAFFRPQITTVCLNREEIGSACVDILMRIWNGEEVPAKSYVKSECIYGESCGCPNSGRVDYREHIRAQIISETAKNADDTLLVELEAQMARQSDITGMFDCIMDYFQKLRCDGMYIVVDRNLFIGDAGTIFPTEGYNWGNLIVAAGVENHERIPIKDVNELNHHLEEKASQSAYMFTPIHFREQSVGYIILKNGHFLYDNPYYYDIHCTIVRMLENRFKQLQLERALGELQELYNHDPLTGAYNRIAYNEWIRPAFLDYSQQGIICALVFLDADNFKRLNDTFGHEYGDKVLQRIVAVLKEQCPEGGYVCRYGGDEFITFFPHATPANTNEYVQKVQELLGKERIEVSMGTKLTQPGDGESLDDYLALADERMYQQKRQRKEQSHDAQ